MNHRIQAAAWWLLTTASACLMAGTMVAACITSSCTPSQLQDLRDIETGLDKGTAACVKLYSCLGVEAAAQKCGLAQSIVEGAMAVQNVVCPLDGGAQ